MVDGIAEEEEPTMVLRVLSGSPPQGLAFLFGDGRLEPITAMVDVTDETYLETLNRLAKELGACVVTQTDV